jgi:four helix bundle protein
MGGDMKDVIETGRKFDLEERLIDFAVKVNGLVDLLPNTRASNNLANQLIRSGMSSALNYGEAQSAESRNDFIHKIKIILKELRETRVSLKIIQKIQVVYSKDFLLSVLNECNQLIAIFVKSIETAERNKTKKAK